ncbi:hypothetical protein BDQ17DRAFT_1280621 [Cyathus striatus]|nr:hypothetical protein BDQ17DRAFT_1280621 [Cyathus striatus]
MAAPSSGEQPRNYESAERAIWSMYNDEAKRVDTSMTNSWKGDMDSILLFAGLFSAALTAFLVEAYQKLQPDSGDDTVALLSQLLLVQHAIAVNGSGGYTGPQPVLPIDLSFSPPTSIVVCNVFWFLSLGFSLSAALAAIFVQQWTRSYLKKIHCASAKRRARMRMYLFAGIQRFHVETIVGFIPTFLHVSLFLFYGGAVAFFTDYNVIIFYVHIAILSFLVALYLMATLLPLFHYDSPFHTPISHAIWSFMQGVMLWIPWRRRPLWRFMKTQSEAREGEAWSLEVPGNEKRLIRRQKQALSWLFSTYIEDSKELESFFEVLPGLLGRLSQPQHRDPFDDLLDRDNTLVHALCQSLGQDRNVFKRVQFLLTTCTSKSLTDEQKTRRIRACEVAVPLYLGGQLMSQEDANMLTMMQRARLAGISVNVMKFRKDYGLKTGREIGNEDLFMKALVAHGWRDIGGSVRPRIVLPKGNVALHNEIAFPILYLIQAVDAGVDPSNVTLDWENQLVDRAGSLFYHQTTMIFLLAFYHASSVQDKTHLEDVLDAHVLKATVKDMLSVWEEFDVLSEDEMRAIVDGVLNLYRAMLGQLTAFPVEAGNKMGVFLDSGKVLRSLKCELEEEFAKKDNRYKRHDNMWWDDYLMLVISSIEVFMKDRGLVPLRPLDSITCSYGLAVPTALDANVNLKRQNAITNTTMARRSDTTTSEETTVETPEWLLPNNKDLELGIVVTGQQIMNDAE